jgi:hypothetical protein
MKSIGEFFALRGNSGNVFVLTAARRLRETIGHFKDSNLTPKIYGYERGLSLNIGPDNFPFFFNVDSNLYCWNFFLIDNGNPELIKTYLGILVDDPIDFF